MNYKITYSNELYHFGIKGQKWGRRRFRNEDGSLTPAGKERYSKEQERRDIEVYGRGAAKRIGKAVNSGEAISGARSREASRISKARGRAVTSGQIGSTVGSIGGAIGGYYLSKYIKKHFGTKISALNDPGVGLAVDLAISSGASRVGQTLGRVGGRSAAMLASGYSPSKFRY